LFQPFLPHCSHVFCRSNLGLHLTIGVTCCLGFGRLASSVVVDRCNSSMYNELYPAPHVNWYPSAQVLHRTNNPFGLVYPEPSVSAVRRADTLQTCSGSGAVASENGGVFMRSEYGIQAPDAADQGMSFYTQAAAQGIDWAHIVASIADKVVPSPRSAASAQELHSHRVDLYVNVDSALDLSPSDGFGPHHFYATAYYPGEPPDAMHTRKTCPVKANLSVTNSDVENCIFHQRVSVPYNSRQQLLMVAIFEVDQVEDTFVGEATVPLADMRLEATSPWPLIRDSNPTGTVMLKIQLPSDSPEVTSSSPRRALPQGNGILGHCVESREFAATFSPGVDHRQDGKSSSRPSSPARTNSYGPAFQESWKNFPTSISSPTTATSLTTETPAALAEHSAILGDGQRTPTMASRLPQLPTIQMRAGPVGSTFQHNQAPQLALFESGTLHLPRPANSAEHNSDAGRSYAVQSWTSQQVSSLAHVPMHTAPYCKVPVQECSSYVPRMASGVQATRATTAAWEGAQLVATLAGVTNSASMAQASLVSPCVLGPTLLSRSLFAHVSQSSPWVASSPHHDGSSSRFPATLLHGCSPLAIAPGAAQPAAAVHSTSWALPTYGGGASRGDAYASKLQVAPSPFAYRWG